VAGRDRCTASRDRETGPSRAGRNRHSKASRRQPESILDAPLTMPPELLKAHQFLDRAVMKLYGFKKDVHEAEIVARLMEKYQELTR